MVPTYGVRGKFDLKQYLRQHQEFADLCQPDPKIHILAEIEFLTITTNFFILSATKQDAPVPEGTSQLGQVKRQQILCAVQLIANPIVKMLPARPDHAGATGY